MPARHRSAVVSVGTIALVTAVLSGCSSTGDDDSDYDYAGVCVDQTTSTRVADDQCDDSHPTGFYGGHGWYYIPRGAAAPAIGAAVGAAAGAAAGAGAAGGTYSPPSDASTGRGFAETGGTVTRGGFSAAHGSLGG